MLTPQLKQTLDKKWDNCWPVSNLRPVAILDLISYIFFIKKLDDLNLITKKIATIEGNEFIYTKEIESFSWPVFKDLDPSQVHELFTKQYGLIGLMKQYGQTDSLYSDFFKERLLINPTPKLLTNSIEIINLVESSDNKTQAAIVEYLFRKAGSAQNQAPFIPEYISRLMVSIAEPRNIDVILDPCAGNGSLLINAAEYFDNNNTAGFHSPKLKGFESNIIHLRMAAMRMMLHGIQSPDLKIPSDKATGISAGNTLVLSSLFCNAVEGNITGEDLLPQPANLQKEMLLLNDIIEQMQDGDRAVVLVPENLLKSTLPDIQKVRKELVETTNLEGVINLSSKSKSLFSSAGIFIFNKKNSLTTSEVWFCKMEKPKKKRTINETVKNPDISEELLTEQLLEVKFLLDKWKNRPQEGDQSNSFTISVYDIKANNYNLNYNDYKLIRPTQEQTAVQVDEPAEELTTVIPSKKENLHHFFEASPPLQEPKRKRKVLPAVLLILLLIITCGWVYFFNYKGYQIPFIQTSAVKSSRPAISKIPIRNSSIQPDAPIKKESSKEENDSQIQEKPLPVPPVKAVSITATSDSTAEASNSTASPTDSSDKYTVVEKAWFHYEPDSAKRKSVFLQARKDLVLTPTAEENGFVYVVYINNKGQSTHGWLDKKDLEPVE